MKRYIGEKRVGFLRWQPIRDPDGDVYLLRLWLFKTPLFAAMLHWIIKPDWARALHDHPWWFVAFVLRGGYDETVFEADGRTERHRHIRWFNFKPAGPGGAHRIHYARPGTITLVFRGRKKHCWGFYPESGFVEAREYSRTFYGG